MLRESAALAMRGLFKTELMLSPVLPSPAHTVLSVIAGNPRAKSGVWELDIETHLKYTNCRDTRTDLPLSKIPFIREKVCSQSFLLVIYKSL